LRKKLKFVKSGFSKKRLEKQEEKYKQKIQALEDKYRECKERRDAELQAIRDEFSGESK